MVSYCEFESFREIEYTCKPRYDGLSIVNIANTILKHFGLPTHGKTLSRDIEGRITAEKILLIVLDGLSVTILREVLRELDLWSLDLFELTSVFPSTTPSALASISTGLEPSQHGIIGNLIYIRELGLVVNVLSLSPQLRALSDEQCPRDLLLRAGVNVYQLFRIRKTIFEELTESGIRSLVLINKGLKNGFSRLIYRGAEIQEYSSLSEALITAISFLNSTDRGLAYIYNAVPDEVAHRRGVSSYEYYETVYYLMFSIARTVRNYAYSPLTVIVTSDHGLIDSTESDPVDMMYMRQLLRVIDAPPYGDSRASHIKVLPEHREHFAELDDVKSLQGLGFLVISRDELIKEKLLGLSEVPEDVKKRLGDYVLVSISSSYLRYSYNLQEREREPLRAVHGSLTRWEMTVPLIVFNLP